MLDSIGPFITVKAKGKEKNYHVDLLDVKRYFVDSRSDPRMGQTEWFKIIIKGKAEDGSEVEAEITLPKKTGFKDLVEKFVEVI